MVSGAQSALQLHDDEACCWEAPVPGPMEGPAGGAGVPVGVGRGGVGAGCGCGVGRGELLPLPGRGGDQG